MFGNLFGGKNKKKPASRPVLSPGVSSAILNTVGGQRAIPAMAKSAQRAFQLSTDPTSESRDFIEIIESDEALSARVIKIANSVYFDRGTPSNTVEQSVTVIGINELRCLLNANSLVEIFPTRHPARSQLWSNDIATALFARQLAKRSMPGKESIAFLAGLMHDVGKLLLIQRAAEDYAKVFRRVAEGTDFTSAEGEFFVFDHTEAGLLVAERWNFPAEIAFVIRNHHQNWPDDQSFESELTRIVKAADIFAHALGIGHPSGFNRLRLRAQEDLETVGSQLNISSVEAANMLNEFKRLYENEKDLYERPTTQNA